MKKTLLVLSISTILIMAGCQELDQKVGEIRKEGEKTINQTSQELMEAKQKAIEAKEKFDQKSQEFVDASKAIDDAKKAVHKLTN